jgi:acetyltransferase-like isoleucine patch superfamily enzyme
MGREQWASIPRLLAARRRGALVSFNDTIVTADSVLGTHCELRSHASVRCSTVGRYASIGRFSKIAWTDVGPFSMISWDVTIGAMPHETDAATTHFFPLDPVYRLQRGPLLVPDYPRVTLGADVWIGCNAVVLSGVSIGTGAVVAAGAVVTRDVGGYEVVAGVPARPVRRRLPPEPATRLAAVAWWDWPDEVLIRHLPLFRRPIDEAVLQHLEDTARTLDEPTATRSSR